MNDARFFFLLFIMIELGIENTNFCFGKNTHVPKNKCSVAMTTIYSPSFQTSKKKKSFSCACVVRLPIYKFLLKTESLSAFETAVQLTISNLMLLNHTVCHKLHSVIKISPK